MEKITLKSFELDNIKINYKGQKIEIKPYISAESSITLTKVALGQFNGIEALDQYDTYAMTKIAFDLMVVLECTNIDCETTFQVYDNLVSSGLMEKIRKSIINYDDVWGLAKSAIELKNTASGLNLIASGVPTEQGITDTLKRLGDELNSVPKDTLNDIAKVVAYDTAIKGVAENKTKTKPKTTKSKKQVKDNDTNK